MLAQVWHLASRGTTQLSRDQFFVALRCIAHAQAKHPLDPNTLSQAPAPLPFFTGVQLPQAQGPQVTPNPSIPATPVYPSGWAPGPPTGSFWVVCVIITNLISLIYRHSPRLPAHVHAAAELLLTVTYELNKQG